MFLRVDANISVWSDSALFPVDYFSILLWIHTVKNAIKMVHSVGSEILQFTYILIAQIAVITMNRISWKCILESISLRKHNTNDW